jgi:mevalonate kinase
MNVASAPSRPVNGHAFGKAILLGEHAVVYGVPAIVAGIDRGASAVARPLAEGPSTLALGRLRVTAEEDGDVARAFAAVLRACAVDAPVGVDAETDLPAAAGLGCSAALGVAVVRALDAWRGAVPASVADVANRAMEWEKVFHGNPSGIDAAAAARGGCLLYQKRDGLAVVKDLMVREPLTIAVGHTGIASTTRAMVERVARLREREPDRVGRAFDAIHALVDQAETAIGAGDHGSLGRLMDQNQALLASLSVSCEQIEMMCRSAKENGALGAKLTGAGGGGCVIALSSGRPDRIVEGWQRRGLHAFACTVAATSPYERERMVVS